MLGYITERSAAKEGFTHHVRLYGILPAYAKNVFGEVPAIDFKHFLIDWIEPLISFVYAMACRASGREPMFAIQIVGEIDENDGY